MTNGKSNDGVTPLNLVKPKGSLADQLLQAFTATESTGEKKEGNGKIEITIGEMVINNAKISVSL